MTERMTDEMFQDWVRDGSGSLDSLLDEAIRARAAEAAQAVEIERLRKALEDAQRILWMAEAYAEAGGSGGPEMRDYTAAEDAIRAALSPLGERSG